MIVRSFFRHENLNHCPKELKTKKSSHVGAKCRRLLAPFYFTDMATTQFMPSVASQLFHLVLYPIVKRGHQLLSPLLKQLADYILIIFVQRFSLM